MVETSHSARVFLVKLIAFLIVALTLSLSAACSLGGSSVPSAPTPPPTKTPRPTFTPRPVSKAVSIAPTATDTPTPAPPTLTPILPTLTPTFPPPTATPTPQTSTPDTPTSEIPTATPTPAPTETLTEVPAADATPTPWPTLAPDVSPFTGKTVSDPGILERRPVAVKISNSPAARPQSGLSKADVVVEHLAEGGVTRFTAIFHSQDAELVGSLRSGRIIDLELPVIFDAFFVYSGASPEVTRMIEESDFAEETLSDWFGDPGFYRVDIPGRAYEHTLFSDTSLLWKVAEEKGWNRRPRFNAWVFSESPPPGGDAATRVEIPYSQRYSDVRYEYDADLGAYLRWVTGDPHVDALTDRQLAVDNIVLVWVNHVETLIVEDTLGSRSIQIQLWGQGQATLLRDGRAYPGQWVRPSRPDPLRILDGAGNSIPFKPGNVWIQLVPLEMEVAIS